MAVKSDVRRSCVIHRQIIYRYSYLVSHHQNGWKAPAVMVLRTCCMTTLFVLLVVPQIPVVNMIYNIFDLTAGVYIHFFIILRSIT